MRRVGVSEGTAEIFSLLAEGASFAETTQRAGVSYREIFKAAAEVLDRAAAVDDEPLFQALRQWRSQQASREGVAPYLICDDRTLRSIAAVQPSNGHELRGCRGIGRRRHDLYGADLLGIVRRHQRNPGDRVLSELELLALGLMAEGSSEIQIESALPSDLSRRLDAVLGAIERRLEVVETEEWDEEEDDEEWDEEEDDEEEWMDDDDVPDPVGDWYDDLEQWSGSDEEYGYPS